MFEPFLSCKAFGLRDTPPRSYVELARRWSGQASLNPGPDGSMEWRSQTTLQINGDVWFESPDRLKFPTTNVLIPLGVFEGAQALAFISPFPIVATGFRKAAARYVERDRLAASVVDLTLQLDLIAEDHANFLIRSIEGSDDRGLHTILTAPFALFPKGIQQMPSMKHYDALEVDFNGHAARLDSAYNIKMADVSEETNVVTQCLLALFNTLRRFTRIA
jgi:hypothetical protein